MRAKFSYQALGEEGADGGGYEERLHAHIDEAADTTDGIIGVEGGENQVAGEGGADGDFRGLEVANFSDHHDVRIGAEDGAEGGGEGEANLVFNGDLHYADEFIFHRIFHGDNAALGVIDLAEEGIEAGGFPGAGGAGDEDDAVGQVQQRFDFIFDKWLHPELGDVEFLLVEKPQRDALALDGGDGGDADVDGGTLELEVDPAILWHAALGDIEPGHDFQTGDDGALECFDIFRHRHLDEAAIDAVADAEIGAERLDVDVRGALVEGFADDLVDELDDGGFLIVVIIDDVGFVFAVFEVIVIEIAAFEDLLESIGTHSVETAEGFVEALAGGHAPIDGQGEFLGGGLAGDEVKGIESAEFQAFMIALALDGYWKQAVAQGEARPTCLAQGERDFGHRDGIEPFHA